MGRGEAAAAAQVGYLQEVRSPHGLTDEHQGKKSGKRTLGQKREQELLKDQKSCVRLAWDTALGPGGGGGSWWG